MIVRSSATFILRWSCLLKRKNLELFDDGRHEDGLEDGLEEAGKEEEVRQEEGRQDEGREEGQDVWGVPEDLFEAGLEEDGLWDGGGNPVLLCKLWSWKWNLTNPAQY